MILSDGEILDKIKAGNIVITPFNEKNLTPNGYDLSIGKVMINGGEASTSFNEKVYVIPPKTQFLVLSSEVIKLNTKLTAQLWLRYTHAKSGILATFGKVDAGYDGKLGLSCFNAKDIHINLKQGSTFCQIVFERMGKKALLGYATRSGHHQHQE